MNQIKANTTLFSKDHKTVVVLKNKVYDLYSEIITEKMYSGKCYMILCENGIIKGFDSDYFEIIKK